MAKTQQKKEVKHNKISKTTIVLYLVVITVTCVILGVMGAGQSGGGGGCLCDCTTCTCICCAGCSACEGCHDDCQCVSESYSDIHVWDPLRHVYVDGDDYWCDHLGLPETPAEPECDAYCTLISGYATESPPQDCPLQLGVCKGAHQPCTLRNAQQCNTGYWPGCGNSIYQEAASDLYEQDEVTCDGKDNDCDGEIDEDCDVDEDGYCSRRMICKGQTFDCESGRCTDCDDQNALKTPDEEEVCDGIDNDCDHKTDEGCSCTPENAERLCEKTLGVCQGAKQVCKKCIDVGCDEEGQLTAWSDCDYGPNYMEDYEPGEEMSPRLCMDGLDNDCDGTVDCADGDCRRYCRTTAP